MTDNKTGYALTLCEGGVETTSNLRAGPYTTAEIERECVEWTEQGDWGDGSGDDVEVTISWTVTDEDGDEVDSGTHEVHIPHNERLKIKLAGGDFNCSHEWEPDESVGCKENPGVMGLGGTKISVTDICSECGIKRSTMHNGSQRNLGQPETEISYTQPTVDSALDDDDTEAAQ